MDTTLLGIIAVLVIGAVALVLFVVKTKQPSHPPLDKCSEFVEMPPTNQLGYAAPSGLPTGNEQWAQALPPDVMAAEPSQYADDPQWITPRIRRSVRACCSNKWLMTIVYVDQQGERSTRTVRPDWSNDVVVSGYCYLRNDERRFKISQIEQIAVHAKQAPARAKYQVGNVTAIDPANA